MTEVAGSLGSTDRFEMTGSFPFAEPSALEELLSELVAGRRRLVSSSRLASGESVFVFEALEARATSARERELLAAAARGDSNKRMALELGVAFSTASALLKEALRRLGFASHRQFTSIAAGLRAATSPRRALCIQSRILVTFPAEAPEPALKALTRAEREVSRLMLRGLTNAAIARARVTSRYTVANQLRAIYQKLGVSSRRELVARYGHPSAEAA